MNNGDALVWRNELCLGDPRIDDDHKRILVIVNAFESAVGDDFDFDDLRIVLRELRTVVEGHFEREEAVMQAVNYPFTDAHKAAHAESLDRLERIRERFAEHSNGDVRDPQAIGAEIADLLRTWLADDILGEDLRLKPYLAQPDAAETGADCTESAGGRTKDR